MFKVLGSARGMTLIELTIAMLLTGIISAAMFKIYVNQHHSWMIQDSVINMQQNARAAIDELSRQLRMAGYSLPNGLSPLTASDANPDTISVYYRISDAQAELQFDMTSNTGELCFDGEDLSDFASRLQAYIYDPVMQTGEFFDLAQVNTSTARIQHNVMLKKAYSKGSLLMAINELTYYVDDSDLSHPRLMLQVDGSTPQIYAEDIEDLNFEYVMKNGVTVDLPVVPEDIRMIEVRVTARTPDPDVEFSNQSYRHEMYSSEVYLRNLGD
jgi:prepilin-type N-terminal cleavage/methylation domain-containing protein